MSNETRKIFEIAIAALTDPNVIDTAYENVTFIPTAGKPYQKFTLMEAKPDNPTIGAGFKREKGYFEVDLFYPQGQGSGAARSRADSLIASLKRGTALSDGTYQATILPSPYTNPGRGDGDRYMLPVIIPYFANVFE